MHTARATANGPSPGATTWTRNHPQQSRVRPLSHSPPAPAAELTIRTCRMDIFSPPRTYLCPVFPFVIAATAAAATSSTWQTQVPPVDGMRAGQSVIIVLRLPAVTSDVSFGP